MMTKFLLIAWVLPTLCLAQKPDTLIVKEKGAVFFEPDSTQIEKRKREVGEENFYVGTDDYLYYMQQCHTFLSNRKFKIFEGLQRMRIIKFVMANNKIDIVNLDTLAELWGVFLFDPLKQPYQIDLTQVETEFKAYYR